MNKRNLMIFVILVLLIAIISGIFLINNGSINIFNNKKTKRHYVGKYSTDNYFGVNATITLNDDDTCEFSNNNNSCVWEFTEEEITLKITSYKLKTAEEIKDFHATFRNKEECEASIPLVKEYYKISEMECEINKTTEYKISLEEDNISLNNYVFTKQ